MLFRKNPSTGSGQDSDLVKSRRKDPEEEYEWDKRRIAIFLLSLTIVIIVGIEIKKTFFPNTNILGASVKKSVEKPNIEPPRLNLSQINSTIDNVKKNVESLDAEEIASSSPQIQKVLRDIQGIKDLPANQAREMCLKVCSGI